MECLSERERITTTVVEVREASYQDKKNLLGTEDQVNKFLDDILTLKSLLKEKTNKIETFSDKLESFTWFNDVDEECLMLLNDVIAATRDWRSTLIKQYVTMEPLRKRGIAKQEIIEFKLALDDLREICEDLESVFFHLPKCEDFVETTKQLALI